jgi:predicted sugar kinase
MPAVCQRYEIEFTHENEAWAFVFYFPRTSSETPATLEADRLMAGLQAATYLNVESGKVVKEGLFTAVLQKDFQAFGRALMALQTMNDEALTAVGITTPLGKVEQAVLEVMKNNGAVAWGQTLTGLGLYGLVYGGQASRILRKKIQEHVGYGGGIVMATIAANSGARTMLVDGLGRKTLIEP